VTDQALVSFLAYAPGFRGGARVAGLDADGDGDDEIVTGNGYGDLAHLRLFERDGSLSRDLLVSGAYNGLYVG